MTDSVLSSAEAFSATTASHLDYWVEQCLSGEESAYVEVYNQYAATIYRLCINLLRNREDAEEVLQDSFEYAFRRLEKYDANRASFKTWLYQIAVSRCRNKRRRKRIITTPLNLFVDEHIADTRSPLPDESMLLTERQQVVWKALGKLSTKLRETAILRYYEGLTYSQIGKVLNIPAKTAESRMRLAHKALRKQLAEPILDNEYE